MARASMSALVVRVSKKCLLVFSIFPAVHTIPESRRKKERCHSPVSTNKSYTFFVPSTQYLNFVELHSISVRCPRKTLELVDEVLKKHENYYNADKILVKLREPSKVMCTRQSYCGYT